MREQGGASKRAREAIEREQRVMSGVLHSIGFELFKEKHYGGGGPAE